jgi:Putative MetA-pathway of phenol degradation
MIARTALSMVLLCCAVHLHAQELEPRTYSNLPVGTNLLAIGYAWSNGNVLLDPALPIEDLDARIQLLFARYSRSFGLLGRNARLKVLVPWTAGDWSGTVDGQFGTQKEQGMGDMQIALECNFIGAPALDRADFRHYRAGTVVGAGVRVSLPTGDYKSDELLNLGSNRYTFRLELGLARTVGDWTFEGFGSVWLFTDNDEFLGNMHLEQKPLFVAKAGISYAFRPDFWTAFAVGFGEGGQTKVDGVPRNTQQNNWRFGATFVYALAPNHGLSLGLTTGITRKAGSDFDTVALAYQYAWGGQ